MQVIRDLAALRAATATLKRRGPLALVPTMGALHAGHLSLVAAGRDAGAAAVAVSIFVNPLQFGPSEDLSRYPRDEEDDLRQLAAAGVELAWLPPVAAMYPPGSATRVIPAGPAEGHEGASRPGHFAGVATVCTKLFLQTGADLAAFGEKDWQQLQVIRRVVADLDLPVAILGVPTMREADGLAMSSRNRRLAPAERTRAGLLPLVLRDSVAAIADGGPAEAVLQAGRERLDAGGFRVDYLDIVDPPSLGPWAGGPGRLVAAAWMGDVRLLDNMPVGSPS